MFRLSKDIDSAFQGVGTKGYASFLFNAIHEKKIVCLFPLMLVPFFSGLEVWCIFNNQLISIPKSSFGRFHSGNAYLLLSVRCISDLDLKFQVVC